MNELSRKAKLIFKAYTELSSTEQTKLLTRLKEYDNTLYKGDLSESLNKSLGPMDSNSCPMCGK